MRVNTLRSGTGALPASASSRLDDHLADHVTPRGSSNEKRHAATTSSGSAAHIEDGGREWATNNSEEDFEASPVNAMGAILHNKSLLPAKAREVYGQSSVASLIQEVQYPPTRTREGPAELCSGAQPRSLDLPSTQGQLSSLAGSSLYAQAALPPRKMAEKFLDSYFQHHHIFYPWLHSITFQKEAQSLWADQDRAPKTPESRTEPDVGIGSHHCPPAVFFGALNAVFALGTESSDLPSHEKDALSFMFFTRAKDLLVNEILSGGSIALVQALLLAGQYLHSTQYPTQCWNSIGLAGRIAIGLGLHSESTSGMKTHLELEIRRRVWYGCLQMDMYVGAKGACAY